MHTFTLRTKVGGEPISPYTAWIENTTYWKNITDGLTKKYRVHRHGTCGGHGQTVVSGRTIMVSISIRIGDDIVACCDI